MPDCYEWDEGVGSPPHCGKLPIPAAKPGEPAAMLSGQTQGTGIVSRLFPLLPHKEPTIYPPTGTHPERGHAQPGFPHSGYFSQASPATSLLPISAAAGSPAAQTFSKWHQLYPVYQDKPHPAILYRGMTPGATGGSPSQAVVESNLLM